MPKISKGLWPSELVVDGVKFDLTSPTSIPPSEWHDEESDEWQHIPEQWVVKAICSVCPVHGMRHGLWAPITWGAGDDGSQPTKAAVEGYIQALLAMAELSLRDVIRQHVDLPVGREG